MKKYIFYTSLLIIFSYGIYLRFYELSTGSFWIDEGYSSIVSYYSYINNYSPYLASGKYDFQQFLFTILQVFSFKFLGISDFSARIPSFLISLLNILLVYIFSINILKNNKFKNIGIIFLMLIFTFSTWQIIWSREARFYELLSFIYLSSTFFLWKYSTEKKSIYFLWFLILSTIGIIFHPFCFGLLLIGFILFIYEIIFEKIYSKSKNIFSLFIVILIYSLFDLGFRYISSGNLNISDSIPSINSIGDNNYTNYIIFYIKNLYSQLGIIFISYILGIIYILYRKNFKEFIIFGLLVIINITAISYGYMAHSRYMFHIYSLITILGGFYLFSFIIFIKNNINLKITMKISIIIFSLLLVLSIFKLTLIPQRYYYIDYTSPKPNFKLAYNYLEEFDPNGKIVTGFPHLCYWYNIDNKSKCSYAIKLNLIGDKKINSKINNKVYENYTDIEYIENAKEIKNKNKFYFLLDDLTIKNAINQSLINNIIKKCNMIYKDVANNETSNFLGIWKCS